MKKTILGILACLTFMTGCSFGDDFSDKLLYTTMYHIVIMPKYKVFIQMEQIINMK